MRAKKKNTRQWFECSSIFCIFYLNARIYNLHVFLHVLHAFLHFSLSFARNLLGLLRLGLANFLVALFVCIYAFLCFFGSIFSSFDVSRTSSTAYHIKSLLPMIYGEIWDHLNLSVYKGPELVISEDLHDGCRRESNWSLTLALGWPLIWTFQTAKFDCDWMGFRVVFISFHYWDVLHERHSCRSQHWSSSSLPIATKSSIRRCSRQSSVGRSLKAKYIVSSL